MENRPVDAGSIQGRWDSKNMSLLQCVQVDWFFPFSRNSSNGCVPVFQGQLWWAEECSAGRPIDFVAALEAGRCWYSRVRLSLALTKTWTKTSVFQPSWLPVNPQRVEVCQCSKIGCIKTIENYQEERTPKHGNPRKKTILEVLSHPCTLSYLHTRYKLCVSPKMSYIIASPVWSNARHVGLDNS